MKLIVCLDDRGGMMFCKRRQSRDRMQISDMKALLEGASLAVSPYTEGLVRGSGINYTIVSDPRCAEAEYCFIENTPLPELADIDGAVIYRWGRHYPSDVRFTLDIGVPPESVYEFAGSSHEKITREIYSL